MQFPAIAIVIDLCPIFASVDGKDVIALGEEPVHFGFIETG